MRKEYQLIRNNSGLEGTTGLLWTKGFSLNTIELPWKDNKHDVSCIPAGDYDVVPYNSPRHGQVFLLKDVPDRGSIEIHIMNWAGDTTFRLKSDSLGCIGVGTKIGELAGQTAILHSALALELLRKDCGNSPFRLKILWQDDI